MSKIIITGGTGFIGSHLTQMLAKENEVTLFGQKTVPPKELNNINFIKGDVKSISNLESAIKGADIVYHLAAQINRVCSFSEPYNNFMINNLGSINVAEVCRKNNVKLVFFSSSSIFGNNHKIPLTETSSKNPLTPYSLNKQFVEEYIQYITPNVSIIRPFNVYGPVIWPSTKPSDVISKFIDNAKHGKDIIIYGGGNQIRDFIHVKDVCAATIKVSSLKGVFNLGTGNAVSLNGLAIYINKLFGNKSKILYKAARCNDIMYSCADVSKIKSIGWVPKISLYEGLKEMI